jgi:nitrogen fixation protein FixH
VSRALDGRHVAALIGGGFALVVGVNLLMAVLASSTFTGSVVKNGYVASQRFNRWLEAGRTQAALGWVPEATLAGGRLQVAVNGSGGEPVTGLDARARLSHPLAAGEAAAVTLREVSPGLYSAPVVLADGQVDVAVALEAGGRRYAFTRRLVVGG